MSDPDFLVAFENTTLPRPEWTHEAHVRMAYLYLGKTKNFDTTLDEVRTRICAYNAAWGKAAGYHETITVAFLRLIADRMTRDGTKRDWSAFREANSDLLDTRILQAHYTEAVLFSPEARAGFVNPARAALP